MLKTYNSDVKTYVYQVSEYWEILGVNPENPFKKCQNGGNWKNIEFKSSEID
jgi:hypothetical protein